ncbi:riboflavin synthase [Agrococcus jejuensis]|uniref:Riboflavin synthase n=1 Tax=Agrococcus jejuensis TaxID=399736 RepID=A0A1G8F932_9MICO|nr:riboflavin synthase [Agrococcus jejuensis]SDH78656.1 riboflavin synthase alpha chain [Agrococcus jejuensis]
MFTGLIEEIGEVVALDHDGDSARLTVRGPLAVSDVTHGASIAVNGLCLTVVEQTADAFTADVMAVSLRMSQLGDLAVGDRVNLERAAQVGDRLGGHIVQGHVDGTATVLETEDGDAWRRVRLTLDDDLAPYVARKGSITLQGVSLTVSGLSDETEAAQWLEVSLIPETLEATTLGALVPGDRVNVETDVVARHVARMLRLEQAGRITTAGAQA